MRRVPGYLIALVWPLLMLGGSVWEYRACPPVDGVQDIYTDAACKSPWKAQAQYNLAVTLRNHGRVNASLEAFEHAADIAKNHADDNSRVKNQGAVALSNIAGFYMDNGGDRLLATAGQVLERARETFPPHEAVLANSIEFWIRTGELERAEAFADAALRFAPDSAILWNQKADVLAVLGDCSGREKALEAMNRLDPLLDHDHIVFHRPCQMPGGF